MRKCRHGRGMKEPWDNEIGQYVRFADGEVRLCMVERCWKCKEWLSLGPAREDDRTAIEVRAAELAARRGFGSFNNCGAGCERCGFVTHKAGTSGDAPTPSCNSRQFHAGYLARAICEHKEQES